MRAPDNRERRLILTFVGLAATFGVTLAVVWLAGRESWSQSTLLDDATVFGVIGLFVMWIIDRHGGRKPPVVTIPPLTNEPPDYIR